MNILMIGNKASGKTTYMTSAYGILQHWSNEFSIRATDMVSHKAFFEQYERLKDNGIYPPATLKRNVYEFDLFYKGDNIHSFVWKDFNGGIIDEKVTEDASILAKDMENSDGLLLFFDSVELKNNTLETRIRQIIRLLANNLKSIENLYYVSIVITKSDMVNMSSETELEAIIEPLKPLVNILNANDNIYANLVPVCCKKAKIINADFPILYMLHGGMNQHLLYMNYVLNQKIKDVEEMEEQAGFIDSAISFICGVESESAKLRRIIPQLQDEIKYYEKIDTSLDRLIEVLNNKDLFKEFRNLNNKYYI